MRRALAGVLVAATLTAGCGGDDEDVATSGGSQPSQTQTAETTQTTEATETTATPEGVPTYEQVAKIALEFSSAARICRSGRDDRDIGGYAARGEIYKRMICRGSPQMDYVVGKEAFKANYPAVRRSQGRSPIWRLDDLAYATGPALDADFAKKVREACDCGEVVPGKQP